MITKEIIENFCTSNRLSISNYKESDSKFYITVQNSIIDNQLEELIKLTKKHKYAFAILTVRLNEGDILSRFALELYIFPDPIRS